MPAKHNQFDPMEVDRVELEYPKETMHEHYNDDTHGDPEGAERRSQRDTLFPDWVYRDFELSTKTYYGKPVEGGKQILIPKKVTIEEIWKVHENGIKVKEEIDNCLKLGTMQPDYKDISLSWMMVFENTPSSEQYPIMFALGRLVDEKLAERAVRKYQFLTALDRPNQNKEYLDRTYENAMQAAGRAGMYVMIHREIWKFLQWKNEPQYLGVRQAIEWSQIRYAEYLDKQHRNESNVKQATMNDYKVAF